MAPSACRLRSASLSWSSRSLPRSLESTDNSRRWSWTRRCKLPMSTPLPTPAPPLDSPTAPASSCSRAASAKRFTSARSSRSASWVCWVSPQLCRVPSANASRRLPCAASACACVSSRHEMRSRACACPSSSSEMRWCAASTEPRVCSRPSDSWHRRCRGSSSRSSAAACSRATSDCSEASILSTWPASPSRRRAPSAPSCAARTAASSARWRSSAWRSSSPRCSRSACSAPCSSATVASSTAIFAAPAAEKHSASARRSRIEARMASASARSDDACCCTAVTAF
mmetsp:Transcript_128993/g.350119  ORF Transcript_128993/g.350119 Transcript_128993/m.350119 type:complete len:285 (+) Transcript_128993:791-1645(+)